MKDQYAIRLRWEPSQIGDEFYVSEYIEGQTGFVRYGPMPERFVQPLIAERKTYFDDLVKQHTQEMMDRIRLPIGDDIFELPALHAP